MPARTITRASDTPRAISVLVPQLIFIGDEIPDLYISSNRYARPEPERYPDIPFLPCAKLYESPVICAIASHLGRDIGCHHLQVIGKDALYLDRFGQVRAVVDHVQIKG